MTFARSDVTHCLVKRLYRSLKLENPVILESLNNYGNVLQFLNDDRQKNICIYVYACVRACVRACVCVCARFVTMSTVTQVR